jgi:hypothetical protein
LRAAQGAAVRSCARFDGLGDAGVGVGGLSVGGRWLVGWRRGKLRGESAEVGSQVISWGAQLFAACVGISGDAQTLGQLGACDSITFGQRTIGRVLGMLEEKSELLDLVGYIEACSEGTEVGGQNQVRRAFRLAILGLPRYSFELLGQ